jgi:hypothetical protein
MPPKNDPAHRHSKPAPHIRRKSKPKFEVPVEAGSPAAPVGWVYRTDDVATPPPPAAQRKAHGSPKSNPFLAAGMGLFFAGAATVGIVSLVALGLAAGPLGFAKGLLARR